MSINQSRTKAGVRMSNEAIIALICIAGIIGSLLALQRQRRKRRESTLHAQYAVLFHLRLYSQLSSQPLLGHQIARHLGFSTETVMQALAVLEQNGWVKIGPSRVKAPKYQPFVITDAGIRQLSGSTATQILGYGNGNSRLGN
jgi:predicted Rossmann fold nucleotide-binding protein DprA/Smf involved in DNA uptake